MVNIARIKQAVWDAFAGTGQRTVEQGLKLRVDEVGWQAAVPAASRAAYFGRETVAVTSERAQAANYAKLVELAACDRTISALYLLICRTIPTWRASSPASDVPTARRGRPSRPCGRRWPRPKGLARRKPSVWRHTRGVVGARTAFGPKRPFPRVRRDWGFDVTAAEGATYAGAIYRLPAPLTTIRRLAANTAPAAVATSTGQIRAQLEAAPPLPGPAAAARQLRLRGADPGEHESATDDIPAEQALRRRLGFAAFAHGGPDRLERREVPLAPDALTLRQRADALQVRQTSASLTRRAIRPDSPSALATRAMKAR